MVDVNCNPSNPVIGVRSFSDDAQTVAGFASAFMKGLHSNHIITALKHYPGHGDTATDSHSGLPRINKTLDELKALVGPSAYIRPGHLERLHAWCAANGNCGSPDDRCAETDPATTMEGLYIKIEKDGAVVDRMKFVRQSFLQQVAVSDTHWLNRPIIPNLLRYPVDAIYEPELPEEART